MAILLFRLKHVPDDEAAALRALLDEHGVDYYETPESRWGISVPALWLREERQTQTANELIRTYQEERQRSARAAYEQAKAEGSAETLLRRNR
ncbi:MAG: DUF6164 family protein [Gammaproteobacteria bacterium]